MTYDRFSHDKAHFEFQSTTVHPKYNEAGTDFQRSLIISVCSALTLLLRYNGLLAQVVKVV